MEKTKKDKTVTITPSGKVKFRLKGNAAMQLYCFLSNGVEVYNELVKAGSGTINGATYMNFANLYLCFTLYTKHIQTLNPYELKLEMSKAEATLLWGCWTNSPYYNDAFLIEPMMKLNQKLT